MFDGFQEQKDATAKKRWFASAGTSIVVYVLVGGVVALLAKHTVVKSMQEPEIDVSFSSSSEMEAEPVKKDEPPPPPPPPKKKGSSSGNKGKRAAVTEVTKLSDVKLAEADAGDAQRQEVDEELFGDGLEDERPAPPAPPAPPPPPEPEPARLPDPVIEEDEVTPAVALGGNRAPAYPEDMRKKGVESTVILKIRISESGEVIDVELLRGEEPFAAAAIEVVRSWRYRPAVHDGQPVAFTRIVKIPFRLRA